MGEYFYGITDKGKRREKNEDTFFVKEILHKQFLVACVIDGVGGYKGGDVAADIAHSVIMKKLEKLSGDVIETLRQAIIAANQKINEEKKESEQNDRMACVLTCAVVDIKNNKCWYAHVGDTRIYLLRDKTLIKISTDHSAVGFLEESGKLSEEEAMRHPRRNEINKALGFEEDIEVAEDFIETGESPFLYTDMLLLCSDGLTDMINSGTIVSVMTNKKNIATKAKALIDAANDAGGNDNITAILVEHNKQPKLQPIPVLVERKKGSKDVAEKKEATKEDSINNKKKNRSGAILIGFFIIALLIAAITVAFNNNTAKPKAVMPPPVKKINDQMQQLIEHAGDSSHTYSLAGKETMIALDKAIDINKDSFHLKGNGATIIADTSYKGNAFNIIGSAKRIVLDSLVIKDFDIGILINKNNLVLKNVRFVNCKVPVQYSINFADTVISGKFKDSIFINNSKP